MRIAGLLLCLALLGGCAPAGPQVDTAADRDSRPAEVSNERAAQASPPAGGGVTYRPPSPDAGVRTSPIVPGRAARVFIFAGVDANCVSLPAPELNVTRQPAKGDLSFRPGQETKLAATASGTCIGAKATGTGVYYTARTGSSGVDNFSVTARLASGETMTRDFKVEIAQ